TTRKNFKHQAFLVGPSAQWFVVEGLPSNPLRSSGKTTEHSPSSAEIPACTVDQPNRDQGGQSGDMRSHSKFAGRPDVDRAPARRASITMVALIPPDTRRNNIQCCAI